MEDLASKGAAAESEEELCPLRPLRFSRSAGEDVTRPSMVVVCWHTGPAEEPCPQLGTFVVSFFLLFIWIQFKVVCAGSSELVVTK